MAKSCGKRRYWQEPWSPNHNVQWNMMLSNTEQVKDLHNRGDVGVRTQPDPMKLLFRSRPPLPRQRQSRINSMILCQVHTSHDDKDKECGPSNLPQYCIEHGSKVSCELTWILMRTWFVLNRYLNKFKFQWPQKLLHSIVIGQNVNIQIAIPTQEASLWE